MEISDQLSIRSINDHRLANNKITSLPGNREAIRGSSSFNVSSLRRNGRCIKYEHMHYAKAIIRLTEVFTVCVLAEDMPILDT